MKKEYSIILVFIICLCFPVFVTAEVVVFKSGKMVEGKIIEKTDKYIKVDFEGIPLTYFLDDIESIDGVKSSIAEDKKESPIVETKPSEAKQKDYFVYESGTFRIKPPEGFNEIIPVEKRQISEWIIEEGVQFGDKTDRSYMRINVMKLSNEGYTDSQYLDSFKNKKFLQDTLNQWEKKGAKIIDYGYTNINGIPAWQCTKEAKASNVLLTNKIFIMYKNNAEFIILIGVQKDLFDSKKKTIEESLATFEIL